MDSIAGNDNVDIREKKKEYRTEDEEEAEEDHLAPSYVPNMHLFLSYLLTRSQAMVVFFDALPPRSRHIWTHSNCFQHLRLGR